MTAYRITLPQCGALSYVALAASSCQALMDALEQHGLQAISVAPVRRSGAAQ